MCAFVAQCPSRSRLFSHSFRPPHCSQRFMQGTLIGEQPFLPWSIYSQPSSNLVPATNTSVTSRHQRMSSSSSVPASKTCASCGRRITWRKKWERNWENIKYCSDACRKRKVRPVDEKLEEAILDLLQARSRTSTICPSEAAKRVAGQNEEDWRPLMESARMAARRLVADGTVEVTQRGQAVDPSTAKGPIRIRLT